MKIDQFLNRTKAYNFFLYFDITTACVRVHQAIMAVVDIVPFVFQLCGLAPNSRKTKEYRVFLTTITTALSMFAIGTIIYYEPNAYTYYTVSSTRNLTIEIGIWLYFLFILDAIVEIFESLGKQGFPTAVLSFSNIDDLYQVILTYNKHNRWKLLLWCSWWWMIPMSGQFIGSCWHIQWFW